jgi:hypothetical protein
LTETHEKKEKKEENRKRERRRKKESKQAAEVRPSLILFQGKASKALKVRLGKRKKLNTTDHQDRAIARKNTK